MAQMSYVNIPCGSAQASHYGNRGRGRLKSHVRVVFRCLLLISKQCAHSDAVDVAGNQVLEEYESFLNSNHIRHAVEHVEIRKIEGGIGADDSDTAEGRGLRINTRRVCA